MAFSLQITDEQIITDTVEYESESLQSFKSSNGATLYYPSNLGQSFQGHWMVINVYKPNTAGGATVPSYLQGLYNSLDFSNLNLSDLAAGGLAGGTLGFLFGGRTGALTGAAIGAAGAAVLDTNINYQNQTTNEKQLSVVLAMPQNNMIFSSDNKYENIALTYLGVGGIAAAAGAALGAFRGAAKGAELFGISNSIGKVIGRATTIAGYPINPGLEIMFSGREQRQFVFEILMSPTNENEAESIQNIIKSLRSFSSPELNNEIFLTPPSSFEIKFYKDGEENEKIPKIKRCALERIEVDFSPSGAYSSFSTGHPVQTRLSLGFREINVLFQSDVNSGY